MRKIETWQEWTARTCPPDDYKKLQDRIDKVSISKLSSLAEYINEHYDGNKAAFGRAFNPELSRQHVGFLVKQGYLVADGKIVSIVRDLPELIK